MYLWIDLETTGLDEKNDLILEAAWFVTNDELLILTEGKTSFVYHDMTTVVRQLNKSPEAQKMHIDSGLFVDWQHAYMSTDFMHTVDDVEDEIMADIASVDDGSRVMLAGASVHFDRGFLARAMPRLTASISHRNLDVSTIRQMMKACGVNLIEQNDHPHRALSDIQATYRSAFQYFDYTINGIKVYMERSLPTKEEN